MNTVAARSTHPLIIIAALAVTLFSVAGIAALMGWLPTSTGGQSAATPASVSAPLADARPAPAPAAERRPEPPAQRVQQAQERRAAPKPASRSAPAAPPAVAESAPSATPPVQVAAAEPPARAPIPAPAAVEPPRPVCNDCGVVEAIRAIQKDAPASGVGAAAGGVLGGVLGHQLGNGRGRDLMTVVGAVGGAVAGHQIEKNRNQSTIYETTVRFDDGTTQRLTQPQAPAWRQGDRVRVVSGTISPL
jgi:outer membrane lipoprotein SlyB